MTSSLGALLASAGAGGGGGGGAAFVPGVTLSLPSLTTTLDVFVAVLRSRTLREEVLQGLRETTGVDVAARLLGADPSAKEKSIVSVTVDATEPKIAADVANAYFDYLDRRLQRSAEAAGKRQEMLYVAQLERAAREVDVAEHELLKFQTENRMLASTDVATKGQVESGAMLRGQIMAMELQREVMRMRFTDQHPEMREVDKRIAELKKQYSRNLFGAAMDLPPESPGAKGPRKEFFVSAERTTPVQFAYLKLLRNLKIQEAFYLGAVQGLQQIQYTGGANRPPEIERLDPALPPLAPARPNRLLIVSVGIVIGLVVAVCGVLAREAAVRALAEQRYRPSPAGPPPPRRRRTGTDGDVAAPAVAESVRSPGSIV
jgi:capsular polysaccharide biosynthesis protein